MKEKLKKAGYIIGVVVLGSLLFVKGLWELIKSKFR